MGRDRQTDRQRQTNRQRDIGGENYKDSRVEFRERIEEISPEGGERETDRQTETVTEKQTERPKCMHVIQTARL